MFVQIAPRAQIAEILPERRTTRRRPLEIEHPRDLPKFDERSAAAIWWRDPSIDPELPEFLLTAEGRERDWLAWLITFAPGLRPFTAYCRVVGAPSFVRMWDAFHTPDLGRLKAACVGLVLGEVMSSEAFWSGSREPLPAS